MATSESKTRVRGGRVGGPSKTSGKSAFATTAFVIAPAENLPKGTGSIKLQITRTVSKALIDSRHRVKPILQGYGDAINKSRAVGQRVSFRVDVDPDGATFVTPFEEAVTGSEPDVEQDATQEPDLKAALAAARERGRLRAAEILSGDDMLNADHFAKMLGTTRVTVNTKRQAGQILGLDGAKRGFRFPVWQLDPDGKPYAVLAELHKRLGGPWATYRFLVQPHGELNGLTGREALERGKTRLVLEAAESVGRDFR